jgi:GrpB-like predicted nucleotidyltransferase (UPF0157 family)
MTIIKQRIVEIVDYDPEWPQLFLELKSIIAAKLGDLALAIEHIGSTSVLGLAAKPIIDLDVVIASNKVLSEVVYLLENLGYKHEGNKGILGREAFAREASDVPRNGTGKIWPKHHLYVCPQNSTALARHLTFRDYLRNNPDQVLAYGELKRKLAQRFRYDIDSYCEAKTQFVEDILKQALH